MEVCASRTWMLCEELRMDISSTPFQLAEPIRKGAASVGTEVVTGVVTKLVQQFLGLPG